MKIERRKLILIIAAIVTSVLLIMVIILSSLQQEPAVDSNPNPVSTPSNPPTRDDADASPGVPIVVEPGDINPPPLDMFENDYSNDIGYAALPDGADGSVNAAGTVFDELWTIDALNRLACELSTKETVTEQALKPLQDFSFDLRKTSYSAATSYRQLVNRWMDSYEKNLGDKPPVAASIEVATFCELALDVGESSE